MDAQKVSERLDLIEKVKGYPIEYMSEEKRDAIIAKAEAEIDAEIVA